MVHTNDIRGGYASIPMLVTSREKITLSNLFHSMKNLITLFKFAMYLLPFKKI
jgi:hypothetical protein